LSPFTREGIVPDNMDRVGIVAEVATATTVACFVGLRPASAPINGRVDIWVIKPRADYSFILL
jgi:hypothetical protein